MRNFYTVVLERMQTKEAGNFGTEPYETAWASEAMFFIRIHEFEGKNVKLKSRAQVSVDGMDWIDEGTAFPTIDKVGTSMIKVSHFGGWLRLLNEVEGVGAKVKLTIHLVLKE